MRKEEPTGFQEVLMHQAAGFFWGVIDDKKLPIQIRSFAYGWLSKYLIAYGPDRTGHITREWLESVRPQADEVTR